MKQIADKLAQYGRHGDTHIGHLTSGEVVVPVDILNNSSLLQTVLDKEFERNNTSMKKYTVGSIENSINPYTGQMEFGFGSSFGGFVGAITGAASAVLDAGTDAISNVVKNTFNPGEMLSGGFLGMAGNLLMGVGFRGLTGYIAGPVFNHIGTFDALTKGLGTKGMFSKINLAGFLGKAATKRSPITDTIADILRGKTIKAATDIVAKPGEKEDSDSIMQFAAKKAIGLGFQKLSEKSAEASAEERKGSYMGKSEAYGVTDFGASQMAVNNALFTEKYGGQGIYQNYGNFAQEPFRLYDDQKNTILAALSAINEQEYDDPIKNFEFLTANDYQRQTENSYKPKRIG